MDNVICHFSPTGGIDDRIAEFLNTSLGKPIYNKDLIGRYRSIYDMENDAPLVDPTRFIKKEGVPTIDEEATIDEVKELTNKLVKYLNNRSKKHLADMKRTTNHVAKAYQTLYKAFGSSGVRRARVNAIAAMFSAEVNKRQKEYEKQGEHHSRTEIINGYFSDGQNHDGQFSIFESIFNKIVSNYFSAKSKVEAYERMSAEEKAAMSDAKKSNLELHKRELEELPKIIKNWSAFCPFVRMAIRDTEGLKLGNTLEYAAEASPENYALDLEFLMQDSEDLEEDVRESWQKKAKEISQFGSLGKEVRHFLSTVPEVDRDGNKVKDDLGYSVKMNPVEAYRYVAKEIRGLTSESSVVNKLYRIAQKDVKMEAIFGSLAAAIGSTMMNDATNQIISKRKGEAVDAGRAISSIQLDANKIDNPTLLTQILCDMHKNTIGYTSLVKKAGRIVVKQLHKEENPLRNEFKLRMSVKNARLAPDTIYDEDGKIDTKNLISWYEEMERMFPEKEESPNPTSSIFGQKVFGNDETGFWSKSTSAVERKAFMERSARVLGISVDPFTISKIYNSKGTIRSGFLDSLKEIKNALKNAYLYAKHAEDPTVSEEDRQKYRKWLDQNPYKKLLNDKVGKSKEGFILEKVNKILDTVAELGNSMKMERRVSFYDKKGRANSRYVERVPCYMGDLVEKINSFVEEKNRDGLQTFLEEKWGQSSFFVKDKSGGHGKYIFRNRWMQDIYDSINEKGEADKEALAKVFTYDEFLGQNINKRPVLFENFTKKQHAIAMLKQYFQNWAVSKGKSTLAKYPSFILGDSGAQMFFTAKRYSEEEILNGYADVLSQEFERMKYVAATNKVLLREFANANGYTFEDNGNTVRILDEEGKVIPPSKYEEYGYRPIENFSETENEFTALPFLNPEFNNGYYWKKLTGENTLPSSKKDAVEKVREKIDTDAFREVVREYLNDALVEYEDKLVGLGVLVKDANGKYHDTEDILLEAKENRETQDRKQLSSQEAFDEAIKDYFWNHQFAMINQIQLFTVDPAYYNHDYPIKDLQKRYKEIYAPGKIISLEAIGYDKKRYMNRDYETAVYFDDVSTSSEVSNPDFAKAMLRTFRGLNVSKEAIEEAIQDGVTTPSEDATAEKARQKKLKELLGSNYNFYRAYTRNTLTDGQGYRSLKSYRAVKGMAGEWTPRMEEAYNKIMAIRNSSQDTLSDADINEIRELATIFQPIKPYLYTLEKLQIGEGDEALIPVQHKYAEVVLIPELMQEGKLKEVAKWMDENDIDLVASTKCVKVGAFGSVNIKGLNDTNSLRDALGKAFVHNLSWSDYRIQSNVPAHNSHAQLYGTQVRKLFLSRINKGKDYSKYLENIFKSSGKPVTIKLPGIEKPVKLTGQALISLYNCLHMANMFDSYESLRSETNSLEKLSDKLLQNVIANANQSEDNAIAFSLLEDMSDFAVPVAEPGVEHDAAALFCSLLKTGINKQRILGGSAVQASTLGLAKMEDGGDLFEVVSPDGTTVLYDELEMPFNKTYKTPDGVKVDLHFEDWCFTDKEHYGELKPSDKIVHGEDALDYLSWPVSGRDKFGKAIDPSQGYFVPAIELAYPGILDLIAYRIPTEKHYSVINGRVFRFTEPTVGGTLKLPSSRTTTAGFDFDIDKLQFFIREFVQKEKFTRAENKKIWDEIYKENPAWANMLLDLKEKGNSIEPGSPTATINGLMPGAEKYTQFEDRRLDYWEGAMKIAPQLAPAATPEEAFNKYLERHRDKYPIFDVYNPEVSPFNPVKDSKGNIVTPGNSRVARNNLIIDLYKQRLRDAETMTSRYTPGGFENNRDAALKMRILEFAPVEELLDENGHFSWDKVNEYVDRINDKNDPLKDPEPNYVFSDPTALLEYNQQNQIADKLIGIFANENINHAYATTMSELKLVEPIAFGSRAYSGLSDFLHAPEGVDVDTYVSEYLAASVDAVKDPVLNFLNLNEVTADAGAVLARLGYSPVEIGLLFRQPVIRDICDYVANNNVSVDDAINEIKQKYEKGSTIKSKLNKIKVNGDMVTDTALANNLLNARHNRINYDGQLMVLKIFNDLLRSTDDIKSFIQCTRFTASNSVGSTCGDQIAQEDKVRAFIEKYTDERREKERKLAFRLYNPTDLNGIMSKEEAAKFNGYTQSVLDTSEGLLEMSPEDYGARMSMNPLAFEQCMYDLERRTTRDLFSAHFPYYTPMYTAMRNGMKKLSKSGILNADTINSLHREFIAYLLSNRKGSKFDGEAVCDRSINGDLVTNREYYTRYYTNVLYEAKEKGLLNNVPFFNALSLDGKIDSDRPQQIVIQGMGALNISASNSITDAWADALADNTALEGLGIEGLTVKDLAEDFYFYNFYKLGFNFHPTSSISNAPTILKMALKLPSLGDDINYLDYVRDLVKGKVNISDSMLENFYTQYVLNHLDNRAFVFTPTDSARNLVAQKAKDAKGKIKTSFTLSLAEMNSGTSNTGNLFLLSKNASANSDTSIAWVPFIAFKDGDVTTYYKAQSDHPLGFNVGDQTNGTMTYVQVVPQGERGYSLQYFGDAYSSYQAKASLEDYQNKVKQEAKERMIMEQEAREQAISADEVHDPTIDVSVDTTPLVDNTSDNAPLTESWRAEFEELFRQKDINITYEEMFGDAEKTDAEKDAEIAREVETNASRGELKTIDEEGNEIEVCPM